VILELIILLLLILTNGLFAMAEIAIVSARKARLEKAASQGQRRAKAALELIDQPNRFLSTVQIGITLIGIFAGAFGGATIARVLAVQLARIPQLASQSGPIALFLVVLAITYLTLVLGELVPKRLALSNPERLAAAVAIPMNGLSRLAAPAVTLLSISTDLVLRLLGVEKSSEPQVSEDEIRLMLRQGRAEGVFDHTEYEMLERVFHLADQRASELMTPRPQIVWLDLEDSLEENLAKVMAHNYSRFPVARGSLDDVLGVAHTHDMLNAALSDEAINLEALLQQPLRVAKNTIVLRVLELFRQTGIHIALLIDEYGVTQGLLTLNNVLEALVDYLPAVDDPDRAVQRADGSWLLDGRLSLFEFHHVFPGSPPLPDEANGSYRTLGGFVITYLGRIPSAADVFHWDKFRFEVVDMDGNRVDKVMVAVQDGSEATKEEE
jgi:putative hemolysin